MIFICAIVQIFSFGEMFYSTWLLLAWNMLIVNLKNYAV